MARVLIAVAVFLVAMSVHAYQGETEDSEPDPGYAKQGAPQNPPGGSATGVKSGNTKHDQGAPDDKGR